MKLNLANDLCPNVNFTLQHENSKYLIYVFQDVFFKIVPC